MNELASKLADVLDVTTKAALDLYPVIRDQFVWYGALDSIRNVFVALLAISLFVSIVTNMWLTIEMSWGFEDWKDNWKTAKWLIITPILSLIIILTIDILSYFLAPDIMIIMELLNK